MRRRPRTLTSEEIARFEEINRGYDADEAIEKARIEVMNIPKQKKGDFAIHHFVLTERDVQIIKIRDLLNMQYSESEGLKAGEFIRLVSTPKKVIVMSNTPMEVKTNRGFCQNANGAVLIGGLGLGMIVLAIQDKPAVRSILVVEKNQEVVDMITPHLKFNEKVKVVIGDIFEFKTEEKFDTLYCDIWNSICGDNYPEMKRFKKEFTKNKTDEAWVGCWRETKCKSLHLESERSARWLRKQREIDERIKQRAKAGVENGV